MRVQLTRDKCYGYWKVHGHGLNYNDNQTWLCASGMWLLFGVSQLREKPFTLSVTRRAFKGAVLVEAPEGWQTMVRYRKPKQRGVRAISATPWLIGALRKVFDGRAYVRVIE